MSWAFAELSFGFGVFRALGKSGLGFRGSGCFLPSYIELVGFRSGIWASGMQIWAEKLQAKPATLLPRAPYYSNSNSKTSFKTWKTL